MLQMHCASDNWYVYLVKGVVKAPLTVAVGSAYNGRPPLQEYAWDSRKMPCVNESLCFRLRSQETFTCFRSTVIIFWSCLGNTIKTYIKTVGLLWSQTVYYICDLWMQGNGLLYHCRFAEILVFLFGMTRIYPKYACLIGQQIRFL